MLRNNREEQILENEEKVLEETYNKLIKKYQDNPNTLLNDYDDMIINSVIGVIAYFKATTALRHDLIPSIDILIRIRKFIFNQYGDNSCSNNKK